MKAEEREIRRKRRVLEHAVESGNVAKTCRYFGVPRSSFYRWRNVYLEHGEEGFRSNKPIAKSHPTDKEGGFFLNVVSLNRQYARIGRRKTATARRRQTHGFRLHR